MFDPRDVNAVVRVLRSADGEYAGDKDAEDEEDQEEYGDEDEDFEKDEAI